MRALVATDADLTVICQRRDRAGFIEMGADIIEAPAGIENVARRLLWEQLSLPRLLRSARADVVHSPHYTFPLLTRVRRVVTVHDLTFFTMPEVHSRLKGVFFRWWIRASRRFRTTVIADSESTAADFTRIVRGSLDRVVVSHLAFDRSIFHVPTDAESAALARSVPDLPPSWIAFLGTLEPRKNVVALIEAHRVATVDRGEGAPALLLAGGSGWDDDIEPAIARSRASGNDVRRLGYLPLETLPAFLGGSTVFAYPSLGEGFGLPVLEAMASGACVLTTDRMSLPEVGGDAVEYTEVDAADIARAIAALLDDPARRAALSAAGIRRSELFSWAAAADRHMIAYRMAADRG